jgi:hypothetical protein
MKRYLFFLRHHNDIDNVAPAIYFFLKEDDHNRADVILYDDGYDYRSDINLRFLKAEFGDRFGYEWLGVHFGLKLDTALAGRRTRTRFAHHLLSVGDRLGFSQYRVRRLLRSVRRAGVSMRRAAPHHVAIRLEDVRRGRADAQLIQGVLSRILEEKGWPRLVIFDMNRSPRVKGLVDNLRALGIEKVICLPVSPLINYNVLREEAEAFVDVFSDAFFQAHDYSSFDAVGFVDLRFPSAYGELLPLVGHDDTLAGKVQALGTIRFCQEWLAVRPKPKGDGFRGLFGSERTRVVVLLSHSKSNVNWAEVQRAVRLMNHFPQYQFVVKPHTRQEVFADWDGMENVSVAVDVDSSDLIDWSEVVVFWSTSVALEGFLGGKFMVCLSYVVGNRNIYDQLNAGYVARCRDDLLLFLAKYPLRASELGYDQEGIDQLLEEVGVLRGGGQGVPERYLRFMESHEMDGRRAQ